MDIILYLEITGALVAAYIIGTERELRNKPAGISTNALVIGGAVIFTHLSMTMEPENPGRIAANIVTGIGFLGAGIILKGEDGIIRNLTTAASIWFSAAIGMLIGFGEYWGAGAAVLFAIIVPRIPHIKTQERIARSKVKQVGKEAKKIFDFES